jgi:sarcosine oxidase subunit gamma
MPAFMIRRGRGCVANRNEAGVTIEHINDLSIVSLKVSKKSLEEALRQLQLAPPLAATGEDPRCLWLGPDRWLLVSASATPDSIIASCNESLAGFLHNAVDYSAGLVAHRISGPNAQRLLASGSGVDFRSEEFPVGTCCRTNFAQVAAIVDANVPDQFDLYVDRSYAGYIKDWLCDTSRIIANAVSNS